MLNKRFKIAKCKTSLKLATSRIKLLRNKKVIQINQMKKELAQLLESGKDRTARIRVEHVIREEKMVAAYDLIEIYCELIVARLPIIESQKTCPIDLKEAITSVIFAAPRCSDIPELVDAQKNFTAKYGKEFVSAAIELRPDCGVSRMMVEKLSAVAPDVQTKMKVLSAVAKEHNVNWDPIIFEDKESNPADDLLNGPTNFEQESVVNVDPPKIQTSNVHNVHNYEENPNGPLDFSQQNKRFTLGGQNITAMDTGGIQTSSASTTRNDMKPSGMASETMNTKQSFHSNDNEFSSGREKWNMEFKDATSAAQAAAESAERASIAARAAAQLSSQGKITRQYSTESHIRHEKPQVSTTSELPGQHHSKYPYSTSFVDRNTEIQQTGPSEHDISPKATERHYANSHGGTKKSSRSDSLRSKNDSVKENSKSKNVDFLAEGVIKKQTSDGSSRSHSNTTSDKHNVLASDQQKVGEKSVDHGTLFRETSKTSSYGDAHRDDETDSDDDGPRFDTAFEYDEGEAKSFFPSPGREPIHPRMSSPSHLSVKSVDPSVNFDLSDGPDSQSESEMTKKSTSPVEDNTELKFGTLTGGLRNKDGLKYPPYTKTSVIDALPSLKKWVKVKESQIKVKQTSKPSSFSSRASRLENKKPSVSESGSESDSDDYSDKLRVQYSKTRSQFAPPDDFFNDDGTDPEEEVSPVPKLSSASRVHSGSGLSRRTKGHVEPGVKTVITNSEPNPESSERKSSRRSYSNKSLPEPRTHTSRSKEEPSRRMPESKVSEPAANPPNKIAESGKTEAPKTSNLSSKTSFEAENVNKPSHVHPKLPEYDSLADRIQFLRANHR